MITHIGTLNINQIAERKDDLLVSSEDIKAVAKNERNKAIDEFAEKIIEIVNEFPTVEDDWGELRPMRIEEMCNEIAGQLKGEKE